MSAPEPIRACEFNITALGKANVAPWCNGRMVARRMKVGAPGSQANACFWQTCDEVQ